MHEAYQPIIDDGRGRFPEDLRYAFRNASRSALIVSACVVGMPYGKPL